MQRLGIIAPRRSTEVPSSPFGFNYGSNQRNAPEATDMLLEMAEQTGFKWMRLGLSWRRTETEPGVYDWSEGDAMIKATMAHGFQPYVTISGGNDLYTTGRGGRPTESDEALAAWQRFLRAAVSHYAPMGVKHWEIWNEPNHGVFWYGHAHGAPKEYARLVITASKVIRDVDPEAVILAGSTAGVDPDFVKGFMEAGAAEAFDIVTFHPYTAVPEQTFDAMQRLRKTVERINPDIELWQGECGLPSSGDTIHGRPGDPWGLAIQAKYLLRRFLTDLLVGVEVDSWYILSDWKATEEQVARREASGHTPRGRDAGVNTKGLIFHGSWEPKPAYFAAQYIGALIGGDCELVEDIHVAFDVRDEGIFYGLLDPDEDRFPMVPWTAAFVDGAGRQRLAWWLPWRMQEMVVPAEVDLTIRGASFQDPVLVDLLEGDVYPLLAEEHNSTLLVRGVPMADYPFMLVERDAVSITQ